MCGISFVWHDKLSTDQLATIINKMTLVQQHRGPDATNIKVLKPAAIGHNRLRVLDLHRRADQPFTAYPDESWLAYNGEIYNFQQLKVKLQDDGLVFATTSDTEVVYHALRLYSTDILNQFNGMFAIAYYDHKGKQLMLARDRFGIKPLYYAIQDQFVVVASEIKTIMSSSLVKKQYNDCGVYQALRFNHLLGEQTSFQSIYSLLPGSWMTIDLPTKKQRHVRYWQPRFRSSIMKNKHDRVEHLNHLFQQSVKSHMVSDVEVGCFMSSGIDSTALASEARHYNNDLTTFSMTLPGVSYNEEGDIDKLVKELQLTNHKIPIKDVSLQQYVDYITSAEMPQWWTTDLSIKQLAKFVQSKHFKVVLSGEGPDEFLGGYEIYRLTKLRSLFDKIFLTKLIYLPGMHNFITNKLMPWLKVDFSIIDYYLASHNQARRAQLIDSYGFYPENIAMWDILSVGNEYIFTDRFRDKLPEFKQREIDYFRDHFSSQVAGYSNLEGNLSFELSARLPNWILHLSDRVSSAHSIELRLPYLDNDIVDFLLSIPESDRIRRLQEKHILREAHRNRVPEFVRKRRKQPLYTPAFDWLKPFVETEQFYQYWRQDLFEQVDIFNFNQSEQIRKNLLNKCYKNLKEQLTAEWLFCFILSTHICWQSIDYYP